VPFTYLMTLEVVFLVYQTVLYCMKDCPVHLVTLWTNKNVCHLNQILSACSFFCKTGWWIIMFVVNWNLF